MTGIDKRKFRSAVPAYVAWVLFWVVAAAINIGEIRITAHMVLLATGLPLSLISLALPHASMSAIVSAAVLAVVQVWLIDLWFSRAARSANANDL